MFVHEGKRVATWTGPDRSLNGSHQATLLQMQSNFASESELHNSNVGPHIRVPEMISISQVRQQSVPTEPTRRTLTHAGWHRCVFPDGFRQFDSAPVTHDASSCVVLHCRRDENTASACQCSFCDGQSSRQINYMGQSPKMPCGLRAGCRPHRGDPKARRTALMRCLCSGFEVRDFDGGRLR